METSLHRELKQHYAGKEGRTEVPLSDYRIDVVRDGVLVEIQHASLAAIRRKIERLLLDHRVRVIKPVIGRKRLIKLTRRNGKIAGSRMSPKRGSLLDLFTDLIYFTKVFPHPRLTLEVVMVDIEELRYPRGKSSRRLPSPYRVQDVRLVQVNNGVQLTAAHDLLQFVPHDLAEPFDTQAIAETLRVPLWKAQQIMYCCHHCGALHRVAKRGNAHLYRRAAS
jgi:hypothetical protein